MIVKLILDSITKQNNDLCMYQVFLVATHSHIPSYIHGAKQLWRHRCVTCTCPARRPCMAKTSTHHIHHRFQNLFRLSLFSAAASPVLQLSGDAVSAAPAGLITFFLSRVKDRNANSLDLEAATSSRFTLAPASIPCMGLPRQSVLCVSDPSESSTGGGVVQPSGLAVSTSSSISVRRAGATSRSGVSGGVVGHETFVPGVGFTSACVRVPPATSVPVVRASS